VSEDTAPDTADAVPGTLCSAVRAYQRLAVRNDAL